MNRVNPRNVGRLEEELEHLSREASWFISHGHAMADEARAFVAVTDFAESAWREERVAALLDALGREGEAIVHRISAASCYGKAGDDTRAANLYRAALSGPVGESTRAEVEAMLARCLARIANPAPRRQRPAARRAAVTG